MGVLNNQIYNYVLNDSLAGRIDSVLHIGDIAYDMCDKQSRVGDTFFNMIQPLAATTPYMLIPGNHEHALYTLYLLRFIDYTYCINIIKVINFLYRFQQLL